MPHRVLSLDEVVAFLHLTVKDVRTLVQRHEIPFEHKGERLVFRAQEIEAWSSKRLLGLSQRDLKAFHKTSSAKAHDLSKKHAILPELMQPSYVDAALTAKTKASLLRQIVALAESSGLVNLSTDLLESLKEREHMCSTALARGFALLHPRHNDPYLLQDSFVVLGRAVQPIPFGAPDGETTDVFFLVCSQEERLHLHVLARLCMICHNTKVLEDLREAAGAKAMYRHVVKAEEEVVRGL